MWMILHAKEPEDLVIAPGKTTTLREFVRMSFSEVDFLIGDPTKAKEKLGGFQNMI